MEDAHMLKEQREAIGLEQQVKSCCDKLEIGTSAKMGTGPDDYGKPVPRKRAFDAILAELPHMTEHRDIIDKVLDHRERSHGRLLEYGNSPLLDD